jgi:hypothetical protein
VVLEIGDAAWVLVVIASWGGPQIRNAHVGV